MQYFVDPLMQKAVHERYVAEKAKAQPEATCDGKTFCAVYKDWARKLHVEAIACRDARPRPL